VGPLGERLEVTAFVPWDFEAAATEAAPEAASSDSGVIARRIRLRVYRDPRTLPEDVVRALLADREGGRGPVHYEVTADTAQADFLHIGVHGKERIPGIKTLVQIDGNALIKDFVEDRVIRTEHAFVDVDHDAVWGDGPLVAESPISPDLVPEWRLGGVGFRMQGESTASHVQMGSLTILEDVDLDVRRLSSGSSAAPIEPGGAPFSPTRVQSRGPAVLTRPPGLEGAYRVALSKSVRVDQARGARLAAEKMTIDFDRVADPAPSTPAGAAPAPSAKPPAAKFRLRTLLAEDDVTVANAAGPDGGALEIRGQRMTAGFTDTGGIRTTQFDGRTELSYEGDVATIGREARAGTVTAVAEERLTYGPSLVAHPRVGGVLRLVGRAHVESRSAGEAPQTIDGDEILLLLPAGGTDPVATKATRRIVGFEARGHVVLDGPQITGLADVLIGTDLDLPTFRVTADGRDARLAVAAAPRAAKEPTAAGGAPAGAAKKKEPKRTWTPDGFKARHGVVANVRAQDAAGGSRRLTLEGDALDFAQSTGRLWSTSGREARMGLPGEAGRDGSVRAPSIGFRFLGDERALWTDGRTQAVVWTGDSPSAGRRGEARGPRVVDRAVERFGARSAKRIEIEGLPAPADAPAMRVRVHEGGALERFEGAAVTDRIEAREIEAVLVERVAVPGEASLLGGRAASRSAGAPPAPASAPASQRAAEPERWTLSSAKRLAVTFSDAPGAGALGGLRALEAQGAVDAQSDALRLEGETLSLDGATAQVRLVAAPGKQIRVTSGRAADGRHQRIVSPEGTFTLDREKRGAMKTAHFRAPVAGSLLDADAESGRASRVLLVSRTGDLVVDDGRASIDAGADLVTATMSRKEAGEKDFQPPMTLTTPHLEIEPEAAGAAGGAAPTDAKRAPTPPFARLTALGRGTRLDIAGAEGSPPMRAIAEKIVYDAKASRMVLSAPAGRRVFLVRKDAEASFVTLEYDPATGAWTGLGTDIELEDTSVEGDVR
jgi:hypothetical protein